MKCALCKERDANKTNTHYLTDSIIRSALNEDGSNERDKGLHFDISSNQIFTDFNFQRSTSPEKIEEALGRSVTDEEIEKSKQSNAFSVDYVFCTECESIFTEIENKFITDLLPKFRVNEELASVSETSIQEVGLFRLFWLMQIWRTSVCDEAFNISTETAEKLRLLILQGLAANEEELKSFPLAVTFLFTGNDPKEYTSNKVGIVTGNKPNLLFMNEFILQFYENADEINFFDFYGLNDPIHYKKYINLNETIFKVSVFSSLERKLFYERIVDDKSAKPKVDFFLSVFVKLWTQLTGNEPPLELQDEYLKELVNWDHIPLAQRLSKERVHKFMVEFVRQRINQ